MTDSVKKYPIRHTNSRIPGEVVQYDHDVFIWKTISAEMRVANSLKKAWDHLGSHLRIKGVI